MPSEFKGALAPIVFKFLENSIRIIILKGEPWFIAADVCAVLGILNATQAIARLDEDERSMFNIGRQGDTNIINESGLYALILRSRNATKPGTASHKFRKWVTAEVLPAIRKSGNYSTDKESGPDPLLESADYRKAAREYAVRYTDELVEAVKKGQPLPPPPSHTYLDGVLSDMLLRGRYLVSFDRNMKMTLTAVPDGAAVICVDELAEMKNVIGKIMSSRILPEIARVAVDRLARIAAQRSWK